MKTPKGESKLNADIRLRRLNLFCKRTNTTPVKLVDIGKKDIIEIENMLFDHQLISKPYNTS
jgi:hypothetical protein